MGPVGLPRHRLEPQPAKGQKTSLFANRRLARIPIICRAVVHARAAALSVDTGHVAAQVLGAILAGHTFGTLAVVATDAVVAVCGRAAPAQTSLLVASAHSLAPLTVTAGAHLSLSEADKRHNRSPTPRTTTSPSLSNSGNDWAEPPKAGPKSGAVEVAESQPLDTGITA
ncbi:hypothetical protein ABVK25_011462 [Lepraria finkii]|uniref:Uncharacterized protein n=1 Tax=Lepraria finkii TaxID=1340010 RepID=A0ABR4AP77_9LECA